MFVLADERYLSCFDDAEGDQSQVRELDIVRGRRHC